MKRFIPAIFGFVALLSSIASAEIRVEPSVEWIACSSQRIYVGKIVELQTTTGPHEVTYQTCRMSISEVVKGTAADKSVEFIVRAVGGTPTMKPLFESQTPVLLFLDEAKDVDEATDGRWVPRMFAQRTPGIDLASLPKLYSKDMVVVDNRETLLKLTRAWAKSPIQHSLWSEVPMDNPIFKDVFSGSACYLLVPAEEKFRDVLIEQTFSKESAVRASAAAELWKFPGEQTVKRLRESLKDDSEEIWSFANDDISKIAFGVRKAAAMSLQQLGKAVPAAVLEREPTVEERREYREAAWVRSFNEASHGKWQVEVSSGVSKSLDGRERTIVRVTATSASGAAHLTLVPKEWPLEEFARFRCLGINGRDSQGARWFYVDGEVDDAMRRTIITFFGLQSPPK